MIKVVSKQEEFLQLKDAWEGLYSKCDSVSPYQSFHINYLAWEYLQNKDLLYILCCINDNDNSLSAILPGYIDKGGTYRFINDIHFDFCDILVSPEFEKNYNFFETLATYIKSDPQIKSLRLINITSESKLLNYFQFFFPTSFIYSQSRYSFYNIVSGANKSFIDSIEQLYSTKDRHRLKKIVKKIDKDVALVYCSSIHTKYPYAEIEGLRNDMIAQGIRTKDYFSNAFMHMLQVAYEKGCLGIFMLMKGDTPLSAIFTLHNGFHEEYIQWIALYSEKQFNLWNCILQVEYIEGQGGGRLNFARGTYEYKMRNFRPIIRNLYCLNYHKTQWKRIKFVLLLGVYYLKQMLKPFLRKK